MTLLKFTDVSLASGIAPLLDKVSRQIGRGEWVCVIRRNGTGKSSPFKVVKGEQQADDGEVWRASALKIGEPSQELSCADERTVFGVVAESLTEVGKLLTKYHHLSLNIHTDDDLARLLRVQQEFEAHDGWHLQQLADNTLSRLQLPTDRTPAELSGSWRRRVLLTQALVAEPDLLLLDEPTNHLDIGAIAWLEEALLGFDGAVLFITYDCIFLQPLAARILELDRGHLIDWNGSYVSSLVHKEQQLAAEETASALFDRRLVQEEVWIRQGIKAHRMRNEGQIRALKEIRRECIERRERQGKASFQLESADKSGRQVIVAEHISFAHPGGQSLVRDPSMALQRDDRISLLGANGTDKTTLPKLLLGDLQSTPGKIEVGTKLEVTYFDQLCHQLEPEQTVTDNISKGREFITIDGQNRHVLSYLDDSPFSPQHTRTPVKALSGGEHARLLLVKLLSKPANSSVLNEPTNDLDVGTLELLKEALLGFQGTVLMVNHDRTLLDNVVTNTLVFEGGGKVRELVDGYQGWLRQGGTPCPFGMSESKSGKAELNTVLVPAAEPVPAAAAPSEALVKKKLSYKLQRELETLPGQIDAVEAELAGVQETIVQQDFYLRPQDEQRETLARLDALQQELNALLECWTELED